MYATSYSNRFVIDPIMNWWVYKLRGVRTKRVGNKRRDAILT